MLRCGLGKNFSIGLLTGYEELKSGQVAPGLAVTGDPSVSVQYIKIRTVPAAAILTYAFSNSKVVPYVFLGSGAMGYQTTVNNTLKYPDKIKFAPIVPFGVGLETFISSRVALAVEASARWIPDWVDLRKNTSQDGSVSAKAGLHFYFGSSDDDDDDNDGLTNAEERRYGTDPHNPDTDGDGLSDGLEVKTYRTNPLKPDTDGDGLTDGEEVYKYHTDPTRMDTDGDGLSDGDEVLKYHTDPLRADTDGDGLTDGEEVLKYHTDPLKVDTDGDGLSDWDEVMIYKTDPRNPDTDGDGLTDGEEVKQYHTDPLKADTDGGGVPDGIEVHRGTNPLDPSDDNPVTPLKLERGKAVILRGVEFETASARLTVKSEGVLQQALAALKDSVNIRVEIAGYTDNKGSVAKNLSLSIKRAESVKRWLVTNGINRLRLSTVGMGVKNPVASNATPDGRAKNRRIEFHVK